MKLTQLKLTNYRNCTDLKIDFDKSKILIIGKNAQGKTNILESIYFLSGLKSPRTSNNTELINFGSEYFKIEAEVIKSNTNIDLYYVYNTEKKREVKVNRVKSTIKDFKSVLKTVLFSTSDRKIEEIGLIEQFLKYIQRMTTDCQNMTKLEFKRTTF